mmetsp:Transcript_20812/g.43872  ORF Transcript_20812/g.43872 Transcript_20812/m.43872 type:complete len:82 (+) Transcript_20812:266-511(+)
MHPRAWWAWVGVRRLAADERGEMAARLEVMAKIFIVAGVGLRDLEILFVLLIVRRKKNDLYFGPIIQQYQVSIGRKLFIPK